MFGLWSSVISIEELFVCETFSILTLNMKSLIEYIISIG